MVHKTSLLFQRIYFLAPICIDSILNETVNEFLRNQRTLQIIMELKNDKKEMKVEKGQTPYQFSIGSEQQRNLFVRKFKKEEE